MHLKPIPAFADNSDGPSRRRGGSDCVAGIPVGGPDIQVKMILGSLIRRLKQGSAESKVRDAVEAGVGVYQMCWELGGEPATAIRPDEIDSIVLEWCRATMTQMRRPYGLDYVTLALSLAGWESEETVRHSFGVLRPGDFYTDGPVPATLAQLMEQWRAEGYLESSRWLSVVMFSWGDLTRELLLAG
jgi:hypothetical protein